MVCYSTLQEEEDASLVPQTNSNSGMFQFAPVNQSAPPKGFVLWEWLPDLSPDLTIHLVTQLYNNCNYV